MNANGTSLTLSQSIHSNALQTALTAEALRDRVPAAFAPTAHQRMSSAYTFISTERVLSALASAGFLPVEARQAARARSPLYTRHLIRLRRRFETIALRDAIPEVLFLNSHDGTSAYQLRVGLYRVVCTNGLVVSAGAFPTWRVAHRGDVVDNVVEAALQITERFGDLATAIERMERTNLDRLAQLDLAFEALRLRFPGDPPGTVEPGQLLVARRPEDLGNDLWRTFNVLQENLLHGGFQRRLASNRLRRTRRITAIREDVRLNSALWELATARAA
ncbi:MAG TPA: DUF932 domain-containing protein [Steroidobacteraceae bacterium]|jgi:hypothetical protein|nr:DUF932 domain-containing protein [Steroidobacteraceae bacterium]